MKRGDLFIGSEKGRLTGKPRPWLVIQSNIFNDDHATFTVLMVSSVSTGFSMFRIPVEPNSINGLMEPSEVQADKIATFTRPSVSKTIGQLDALTMEEVDKALRRWLDL